MEHVEYLLILCAGWLALLWVDRRYGAGVIRCWRRLAIVEFVVLVLFLAWDCLGVHRGYWRTLPEHVVGWWPLPGVPVEEVVLLSMIAYGAIVLWRLTAILRRVQNQAGSNE